MQKGFAEVALTNNTAALTPHVLAARGTPERRLGVYRTNTVNSLTDVLLAAYPVTQRIVGDRFFRAMATAFVETHPPIQPTLYQYGGDLAAFLERFDPAKALPYLPDIARLEWARIEAYFASDQDPLDPDALANIPPENLSDAYFVAHSATRLVQSDYPVFEIWAVNQTDQNEVPKIDFTRGERGFIARRGHTVTHRHLNIGAFHWLDQITNGVALGPATESALSNDPDFNLQDTLQLLLPEGVFTSVNA